MHDIYCGLCEKKVKNWKEHLETEEHKENMSDPVKIMDAVKDSGEQMINRMSGEKEKK